jgi:dTDP-L-rhamnose 4-epimerase
MRVLVTGGAGFIGSHVVDALVARGADVVVLDCLDPATHTGPPAYLNAGATYVWADVRDADAWRRCLAGVDAVCHQAAKVGLGVDLSDVDAYVAANGLGTASMLRALHESHFRGRLVLASSMVVYGEGRYACAAHGAVRPQPRAEAALRSGAFEAVCPRCETELVPHPVGEDAPLDPRNVYAATKVHQEHLCAPFARETGTIVTTLRYHNVYGPRMPRDTPYAGVAAIFRSALEAGRPPEVFEDGGQLRDFVHVRDVAHANVIALTTDRPFAGALNIASGEPHTVADMARALADAFGGPPPATTGRYRLGDVRHVFASTGRARRELGFAARVRFADGMHDFARAPLRGQPAARADVRGDGHDRSDSDDRAHGLDHRVREKARIAGAVPEAGQRRQ